MRLEDVPRSGVHNGQAWTLEQETITRAKAQRWVRTIRGRRLQRTKIRMYETLMRQGKWRAGGRITIHGNYVVKGRHALAAIASTGIPQEMWVLRIVDPKSSHPELR